MRYIVNTFRTKIFEIIFFVMFLVSIFVSFTVELQDNEAYYWSWSLKPALPYFDHPPLLSWILWVTTNLFGKTNFAVRLPAIICLISCLLLSIRWMRFFKIPEKNAFALSIGSPLVLIFSWMSLPDVLFLPLGLLAVDCIYRRRYVFGGISLGLSLLSKWHALLLFPGLLFVILSGEKENKKKVASILKFLSVSILLQIPVFVWNIQNNFVSFRFHFIDRHSSDWGSLLYVLGKGSGFIAGMLGIFGLGFIYLVYIAVKNKKHLRSTSNSDVGLLLLGFTFFFVFLLSALKGETRIYWAGFALFPLTIYFLKYSSLLQQQIYQRLSIFSWGFMTLILLRCLYLPIGSYSKPIFDVVRSYDLRLSPRGDLAGWREW